MCKHEHLHTEVSVDRLEDEKTKQVSFCIKFRVSCHTCGEPFSFIGVEKGKPNPEKVSCSNDTLELRSHIQTISDMIAKNKGGFSINRKNPSLSQEQSQKVEKAGE